MINLKKLLGTVALLSLGACSDPPPRYTPAQSSSPCEEMLARIKLSVAEKHARVNAMTVSSDKQVNRLNLAIIDHDWATFQAEKAVYESRCGKLPF